MSKKPVPVDFLSNFIQKQNEHKLSEAEDACGCEIRRQEVLSVK